MSRDISPQEGYPRAFWVAVGGAVLSSLQFGYQIGVLNTVQNTIATELDVSQVSLLSTVLVAGAAVGALFAGLVADAVGPKSAQVLNNIVFALGAVLSSFTPWGWKGFLLGRLLSGMGAGAASLYAPRYIAEISPSALRGKLGTQNQVFINVGILLAYMAGAPYEAGVHEVELWDWKLSWWRIMIALALVPASLQVLLLTISPESPIWLQPRNSDAADISYIRLWGFHAIMPIENVDIDVQEPLVPSSPDDDELPAVEGWGALLRYEYRWMMVLAVGLPVLQQASGINTVIYFSSEVFERAGVKSPIVGSIIMGMVNLIFTITAGYFMDRSGRRQLMKLSFGGMTATLLGVALVAFLPTAGTLTGDATLLLILGYVMFFALGCGPIPWLYMPEILPSRIKGRAASFATTMCWLGNLVVVASFQPLLGAVGVGGSYLVFALLNAGGFAFVALLMVETKQKSLAEIEAELLLDRHQLESMGSPGLPRSWQVAVERGEATFAEDGQ